MTSTRPQATQRTTEPDDSIDHERARRGVRLPLEAVGLPELTRYVRRHSRRLTMREELTTDVASGLADELEAPAVLVELTPTHRCGAIRGIETGSTTTTRGTVGSPTGAEPEQFRTAITRTGDAR